MKSKLDSIHEEMARKLRVSHTSTAGKIHKSHRKMLRKSNK